MQTKFEQLLDYLVNEETEKANELFHTIVVEKSRTIYENMIAEESDEDKDEDKDEKEDDVEESFGQYGQESVIEIGGDQTDDLIGDVEFGDEEGEEGDDFGAEHDGEEDDMGGEEGSEEARIDDLEDALAELKAEFEQLMAGEEGEAHMGDMGDDMSGEEDGEEQEDEQFIREYTEKVGGATYDKFAKGGDNGQNAKSIVAGKNDMGGSAFKLGAKEGQGGGEAGQPGGQLKGSGLLKGAPKDMSTGNINVPGGNAGKTAFKKKEAGHGAEKKGSAETADKSAGSPLNGAPNRAK